MFDIISQTPEYALMRETLNPMLHVLGEHIASILEIIR